jgi:hypothetical protein
VTSHQQLCPGISNHMPRFERILAPVLLADAPDALAATTTKLPAGGR